MTKLLNVMLFLTMTSITTAQNNIILDDEFTFSSITWLVKKANIKTGPGYNYFGIDKDNVSIDKKKRLVLSTKAIKNGWSCAEIVTKHFYGNGTYEIELGTNPSKLPQNIVFGFFTYNELNTKGYDEADIEFSKWNETNSQNGQFAIHIEDDFYKKRFSVPSSTHTTICSIEINKTHVSYRCTFYNNLNKTIPIDTIQWRTDRPIAMLMNNTQLRLNLWLYNPELKGRKQSKVYINRCNFSSPIKHN